MSSAKQGQTRDMTQGSALSNILIFAIPLFISNFFQQCYNIGDTMIASHNLGQSALAAIGLTGSITGLVIGFANGINSGYGILLARAFGSKNEEQMKSVVAWTLILNVAISVLITVATLLFAEPVLRLIQTPEDVFSESRTYLTVVMAGMATALFYNMGSGLLRAVGNSKIPLYFLIFCCFCNIFLDLLLVMVFHMGVLGVALGTLISQALSSVLILRNLMRTKDIYRLELRKIHLHAAPLSMLLKIGLPSGLQSTMYNIANMVIQTALNSFGTDTMAAWTAFGKVDSFYWMISSAFGVAITTFVGQNYGAGKIDRMKKSVRVCFCMDLATALTLSALMYLFLGKFLLSLFTTDAEVLSIGVRIMQIIVPAYAPFVFIEIFSGALRGAGNVLIPMLLTCGGICVTRILWIFFFVPSHRAVETIIFSYPGSWVLTATLFILYFAYYTRRHWGRGATRDLK